MTGPVFAFRTFILVSRKSEVGVSQGVRQGAAARCIAYGFLLTCNFLYNAPFC